MEKADLRILLVDDEPSNRETINIILRYKGYMQIKEAGSCEQTISLAREYKPHIILCDTKLPDGLGFNYCGRIKEELGETLIAIIGLSNDPDYRTKWLEMGYGFILKTNLSSQEYGLDAKIQEVMAQYQSPQ